MKTRSVLVCGATGFIGRNLLEAYAARGGAKVRAVWNKRRPPSELARDKRVAWVKADLRDPRQAANALTGVGLVLQAAATTSGSKDIVERPFHHVTDNAVMNSHLFRLCHELGVGHLVYFSCSVMYTPQAAPVKEGDFRGDIAPRYFGVGWTKVYLERMAEFYSRLGKTRYTVIRHSNVYGPHDKYDLEKSHVFGATVAKVMTAPEGGEIVVWGDGKEGRDLLHVDDLTALVAASERQAAPYELVNAGSGEAVPVGELVRRVIAASGRRLTVRFDASKPSIPFTLALDSSKARELFGWSPRIGLDEGIRRSLGWYRAAYGARPKSKKV